MILLLDHLLQLVTIVLPQARGEELVDDYCKCGMLQVCSSPFLGVFDWFKHVILFGHYGLWYSQVVAEWINKICILLGQ
jgi:hypothetical protein